MFIDYVTLMLVNMSAGLTILASYIFWGLAATDERKWVPGLAMSGLVALLCGLHMTFTWPLPGSFNMAFGELSVLLGILLLAASLAIAKGWSISLVTVYAFFAGITAIVIGAGIIANGMTQSPGIAGTGFILTGITGVLAYPILKLRRSKGMRSMGALSALLAALIWAFIGYMAYWGHLTSLATWTPPSMAKMME